MAGNRETALANLQKANLNRGSRKGVPNKWTKIQNSIAEVYESLGGAEGLLEWVLADKSNERDFYNHICRSMGNKVDINIGKGAQIMIVVDDLALDNDAKVITIDPKQIDPLEHTE